MNEQEIKAKTADLNEWALKAGPRWVPKEEIEAFEYAWQAGRRYGKQREKFLLYALEKISNLLTHSRPEEAAEIVNQAMMVADIAISDYENE